MASWAVDQQFFPSLRGIDGDLVWVRISVEPRRLEVVLDALCAVAFPINPEIEHPVPGAGDRFAIVEFPAYSGRLAEIESAVRRAGLADACISVQDMMQHIKAV